jgi:hypothetical protein
VDVSNPEKLIRGMYGDPDRPVIEQDNDIETPFDGSSEGPIPQHLQEIVQAPRSVDPEVEEIPQIHTDLTVDTEKVFEENAQSRFQILDLAIKKPGVCALCGSSGGDGRQFVDFGKSVEWYGVVYFFTFCISEAAKLLGLAPKSDYELALSNLQAEISKVDDMHIDAKVKLDAANLLLRNHLNGDCCTHVSDLDVPEAVIVESESSGVDDESSSGDESDADESDSVEGPDDVPADSGDDEFTASGRRRRPRKSAG